MSSGPQEEPSFRGAEEPGPPLPAFRLCAVCGKPMRTDAAGCPWCAQAERWRDNKAVALGRNRDDERTFTHLLWAFVLVLLTNVILMLSAEKLDPDKSLSEA